MKIGLDVGGTNLRAALVSKHGILKKEQVRCPAEGSVQDVVDALCGIIDKLFDENIESLGAGIPSVVDSESGIVYNTANIPSWKEVRLKEILHKRYNVPVAVENDSNCFALGVSLHEQDNKFKHMVGITLGTGLGCGVVINGKLYRGANGAAGEIGSLPYLDSDVEHYCGSMFFSRFCHKTALQLYGLAKNGDAESIEKWHEFGCHMGNMVKMVMFAYDPDAIYFGGGISQAFSLFEQSMNEVIKSFPYPKSTKLLQIRPTRLQDAALLGAASLI